MKNDILKDDTDEIMVEQEKKNLFVNDKDKLYVEPYNIITDGTLHKVQNADFSVVDEVEKEEIPEQTANNTNIEDDNVEIDLEDTGAILNKYRIGWVGDVVVSGNYSLGNEEELKAFVDSIISKNILDEFAKNGYVTWAKIEEIVMVNLSSTLEDSVSCKFTLIDANHVIYECPLIVGMVITEMSKLFESAICNQSLYYLDGACMLYDNFDYMNVDNYNMLNTELWIPLAFIPSYNPNLSIDEFGRCSIVGKLNDMCCYVELMKNKFAEIKGKK